MDARASKQFYRAWIVANGWAEALGLGSTFVLGRYLAARLDGNPSFGIPIAVFVGAVVLGTLLEGVLVGMAQEGALRQHMPRLVPWRWTKATAAGAGLAWALGMLPSTVAAIAETDVSMSSPVEPEGALRLGLAVVLGLITGPILGAAQWIVLRELVRGAGRWLWANAAAWAVGMPLIFAGMDLVPWSGHPALVIVAINVVCLATGVVVGAIHGRVLMRMM